MRFALSAPPRREVPSVQGFAGTTEGGAGCTTSTGAPTENLRGPESGRRNPSLADTDCGHHVCHRRRFSLSARLTAVTRPPDRAPQSAHRRHPPRLPASNQSGVEQRSSPAPFRPSLTNREPSRAGVPPLHAAPQPGATDLSTHEPAPFGSFSSASSQSCL